MRLGLRSLLCLSFIGLVSQSSIVSADMITGVGNVYPPPGAVFDSTSPPVSYGPGGPAVTHVTLHDPNNFSPYPAPGNTVQSFFDVFTELSFAGAPPVQPVAQAVVSLNGLPPGQPIIRSYSTEMLALNIAGGGLPPGMMLRESPTLQSTGQTNVTDIGGGQFRISSFFDVFTELTLDGGQSWVPASGPIHVELGVPEPASASLIALGSIMLVRRRK